MERSRFAKIAFLIFRYGVTVAPHGSKLSLYRTDGSLIEMAQKQSQMAYVTGVPEHEISALFSTLFSTEDDWGQIEKRAFPVLLNLLTSSEWYAYDDDLTSLATQGLAEAIEVELEELSQFMRFIEIEIKRALFQNLVLRPVEMALDQE